MAPVFGQQPWEVGYLLLQAPGLVSLLHAVSEIAVDVAYVIVELQFLRAI
jgi:hypothetical protein